MALNRNGGPAAPSSGPRRVTILGSTGSIGQNTIDLLQRNRDDFTVEALVALTMTFGQGYALERLEGIETGHAELLDWIERRLESLEERSGA